MNTVYVMLAAVLAMLSVTLSVRLQALSQATGDGLILSIGSGLVTLMVDRAMPRRKRTAPCKDCPELNSKPATPEAPRADPR